MWCSMATMGVWLAGGGSATHGWCVCVLWVVVVVSYGVRVWGAAVSKQEQQYC